MARRPAGVGSSVLGSLDRAHLHPRFIDWPCRPVFVEELSADAVGWVGARLADPAAVRAEAGA